MNSQFVYYLPLDQEIIDIVKRTKDMWEKIYPLLEKDLSDYCDSLGLTFYDMESAKAAVESIATFRQTQDSLDYDLDIPKGDPFIDINENIQREHDRNEIFYTICIPFSDFIPEEYKYTLDEIDKAVLHYIPLYSRWFQSLKQYIQTYDSLEIINYSFLIKNQHEVGRIITERDFHALHHSLLSVAKQIVAKTLNAPPIYITIGGTVKKLTVSVNRKILDFARMEVRGIAALSQMEYNHWFSLEDFCNIAFPGDVYNARNQFNASLKVFKQFSPFDWDAEEGLRRIKGAVIKSEVDKAVLHFHLNQQKSSQSDNERNE